VVEDVSTENFKKPETVLGGGFLCVRFGSSAFVLLDSGDGRLVSRWLPSGGILCGSGSGAAWSMELATANVDGEQVGRQ